MYLDYGVDWVLFIGIAVFAIGVLWGNSVFLSEHGNEGCGFYIWTLGMGIIVGVPYALKSKGATLCLVGGMAIIGLWALLSQ
jgi:hypothetical protein